jgi:hypothetical protein
MTATAFPDQYNITYGPVNGQTTGDGDSGAPFWKFFQGVPYQVGVESSRNCGVESYAARPENFEQWVFEVIYNAPNHIPTTDTQGRGLWFIPGPDPEFWHRPLRRNWSLSTPFFDPCPGSTTDYKWTADYQLWGNDWISVQTQYPGQLLTGNGTTVAMGNAPMSIGYGTGWFPFPVSVGMNWMTVQCDYGQQDAELVCHGARCGTTRDPLPNNFSSTKLWDPCGGGDFMFLIDYDFEYGYDFVWVGHYGFTGRGSGTGYAPRPIAVTVWTDPSIQSRGIQSLKAVCRGW